MLINQLAISLLLINSNLASFDLYFKQDRITQASRQLLVLIDANLINQNENNWLKIEFSDYFEENMLKTFLNHNAKNGIFYKKTKIVGKHLKKSINHMIELVNEINSDNNVRLVLIISDSSTISYFQNSGIEKLIFTICTNELNFAKNKKEIINLNPSLNALLKIVITFKKLNKLDDIFIFTSNEFNKYILNYFKSIYSQIKVVNTIDSFDKIQLDMSHSLILLKCNLQDLLKIYSKVDPMQYVIWLPEEPFSTLKHPARFSGYHFFQLNWHVNLDYTLSLLIDQFLDRQANSKNFIKDYLHYEKHAVENSSLNNLNDNIFSEMLTVSKFLIKRLSSLVVDEYNFEIKNGETNLIDDIKINNKFILDEKNSNVMKNKKYTKFKIVCNLIEPFLIATNSSDNECSNGKKCLDLEILSDNLKKADSTNDKNIFKCCKGYITDLLDKLAHDLNFEYDLMLSNEKKYIEKRNGAINELLKDIAQIAAGPFRINENQSNLVDFSVPFLYSGYGILIKQSNQHKSDLFMFLKPFTYLHWLVICLFTFVSAVALSLLEFISPFGLNPNGRARNRNYTLGSGITMVMSLMFMHTMPAKSPKSWAGKWTQNFIAAYAIIFISTYTAQMAFILSDEQKHTNLDLVNHTEFLSQKGAKLKLGFLECNSNIYQNLNCTHLTEVANDNEGIKSVNNGTLDAFISDYLILDYLKFKQIDCSLQIVSREFLINGYSLAFSKGMKQQEKNRINMKISDYQENGFLDELYFRYFERRLKCRDALNDDQISINLPRYKGVYAYLGLGIIAAVLVLFLEQVLYKYTIPFLRSKNRKSQWRSLKLMYFSQRFYRIVESIEFYDAVHSAREFLEVFKRRDFEAIFQKSFRKKQMEILNTSKLKRRPKFWALIEATTERHSMEVINSKINLNMSEITNEGNTEKYGKLDQELDSQSNFNLDDDEDFRIDIKTPNLEVAEKINISNFSLYNIEPDHSKSEGFLN